MKGGWRDVIIGILASLLLGSVAILRTSDGISEERARSIVTEQVSELKASIRDLTAATLALRIEVTDLQATIRKGSR